MKIKAPKPQLSQHARCNLMTIAIYAMGAQTWWSAFQGCRTGGVILLILALAFTVARDVIWPMEVRGFKG